MHRIALALCVVAGCGTADGGRPSPPPDPDPSSKPVATPRRGPVEELVDGWYRVDLGSLSPPIAVTVEMPPGARLASTRTTCRDDDGLELVSTDVSIRIGEVETLHLSTCQEMGFPLTTLADAVAAYRAGVEVVLAGTHETPTGEWAVTLADGFVVGWSPRARVMCRIQQTAEPAIAERICLSVAPTGKRADVVDLKQAFPNEPDAVAREALATLQRATARRDARMFLSIVDPAGLDMETPQNVAHVSVDELRARLERDGLERFLHISKCGPYRNGRVPGSECQWVSGRDGDRIHASPMIPSEGRWPALTLARGAAGWRITRLTLAPW